MTIAERTSKSPKTLVAELARVPIFRDLPMPALQELARSSRELRKGKGEFIFHGEERPQAFFHVLSGQVKIGISSDQGEEKIIEICSRGDSFGLAGMFSSERHGAFAQATAATTLLRAGKDGFLAAIAREPQFVNRLVTALADQSSALERDIAAFCTHSARRRVLDYFLHRAAPMGASGKTVVTLDIRKGLIAARLSLTPETFSRALRDLSEAGLISVRGRHVTLEESLLARRKVTPAAETTDSIPTATNRRRSDALPEPIPPARPISTRAWI